MALALEVNLYDSDDILDAWPELEGKEVIHLAEESVIQVGIFKAGMSSGRPSVAFRLNLPDGRIVVAETSARLFCAAAKAVMTRYPDLYEGE